MELSKSIHLMSLNAALVAIVPHLLLLLGGCVLTNALDCYICSYVEGQRDMSCLTNISALPVLNCTKKYCLTVREEYLNKPSQVRSFLRDCQDKPMLVNGIRTDDTYRNYHRSCQQNLCNGHNGRVNNSTGGPGGGSDGGNHNAIIPGKNNGYQHREHQGILLLILIIYLLRRILPLQLV